MRRILLSLYLLLWWMPREAASQSAPHTPLFTRADTLRGSLNENRTWWDVQRYDIEVEPDFETETIRGKTHIHFNASGGQQMQLDLQQPMVADSMFSGGHRLQFKREGQIYLVRFADPARSWQKGQHEVTIYYHGKPQKAVRPPWSGGWIWKQDALGRPWMSVACQRLGASVWYPCKDHQSDEPDNGASLTIIVPDSLVAVGNGRLISTLPAGGKTAWRWEVRNPINNYNIIPYIGKYVSFSETYRGAEGALSCQYWVLDYELEKAREQFRQVKPMLQCFEYWFGAYPFYEDGYQLVQAPHLGMEHQSAVAYGNKFMNGYMGTDLSGSGWGSKWDFIIVHESGHEWFGNNITTADVADMWVHESFTNYSETLFTECAFGKEAGEAYVQGTRKRVENDRPVIGNYGVNHEGSGDMYYKGGNMIHTIRTLMQNDSLFRKMLRDMNSSFYHRIVTSRQVEDLIQRYTSFDCRPVFDQYLRDTRVPVLEWTIRRGKLMARFSECRTDFKMPVFLPTSEGKGAYVLITAKGWTGKSTKLNEAQTTLNWNKNLFIHYRKM